MYEPVVYFVYDIKYNFLGTLNVFIFKDKNAQCFVN